MVILEMAVLEQSNIIVQCPVGTLSPWLQERSALPCVDFAVARIEVFCQDM